MSVLKLMFLAACLLANAAVPGVSHGAQTSKPNIVVILADDLGFADVGFNGGKEIKTPNIDKLAAAGARLEQFYVQPLCSPTRAALMTGRYPMRQGLQTGVVRPWAKHGLPLDERTLPQALKEAGYATAITGKWHLGHFQPEYLPTRRGFDFQYGHYNGAIDYFKLDRSGGHDWHRNDKANYDEGYSTHLIAREAVKFIQGSKQPFFLFVSFNAVHSPYQVPEEYKAPYTQLKEPRRTYAGMLAAMDEAIGQINAALDEKDLRKNTLIVFASDNGGPHPGKVTDNGPLRAGKSTLYEGGVRAAASISWEGRIKAGSTIAVPLHIVDLYPTLLRLAGASLRQTLPIDGQDAFAIITQGTPAPPREILLNATLTTGAIRVGDWKLILNGTIDAHEDDGTVIAPAEPLIELFNLANDPYEKQNLAKQRPEMVSDLRVRYDKLAAQAVAPKASPRPADFKVPKVWGAQ
jgi:arylsulfatase A-like enzyme